MRIVRNDLMDQSDKIRQQIFSKPNNKERIQEFINLGLNPKKGLSNKYLRILVDLYVQSTGDTSMAGRYNCSACMDTIWRKVNDFLIYDNNVGKKLINWPEKSEPGISIIIPTNRSEYIDESLQSIIGSIGDLDIKWEILIGIDADMATADYIRSEYGREDDRNIKIYYFNEKSGPYIIRNTLADISKYEYLLFFDDDDLMSGELMEKTLEALHDNDCIRWSMYNFNESTENIHKVCRKKSTGVTHGVFAIKKEIFMNECGFYPWLIGADTEFKERVHGYKKIDTPIWCRLHPKSLTNDPETGHKSILRKGVCDILIELRKNGYPKPEKLHIEKNIIKL